MEERIDNLEKDFWLTYYSYEWQLDYIDDWIIYLKYFDDSETFYNQVDKKTIIKQIKDYGKENIT